MEFLVKTGDKELIIESQRRNICEEVVDRLRHRRLELGLTQQDIADITGIKRPNIARLEGCTTTPSVDILIKYAMAVGCKLNISIEEDETQRVGRNKETLVDSTYIASNEYRRQIDLITESSELNRLIYQKVKEMLIHRSGTEFEDMYWFDMETETEICSKLDETNTKEIRHTKAIDKKLKSAKSILAIHTHPHSMPPSVDDFNSYVNAGYQMGIVICHDGTIYRYYALREISSQLMELYINRYYLETGDERTAQICALNKFMATGDIFYEEVHL